MCLVEFKLVSVKSLNSWLAALPTYCPRTAEFKPCDVPRIDSSTQLELPPIADIREELIWFFSTLFSNNG